MTGRGGAREGAGNVEINVDLKVERREWIRICGDIQKHSFFRLEANVAKIARIFKEHEHTIQNDMAYTMLSEFSDWFHTHLFAYHASTIAEFLNNIRWEIYNYLKPEFARAFHRDCSNQMYGFHVPEEIKKPLSRSMYWELMNRCRAVPYFPRFTVTEALKKRY